MPTLIKKIIKGPAIVAEPIGIPFIDGECLREKFLPARSLGRRSAAAGKGGSGIFCQWRLASRRTPEIRHYLALLHIRIGIIGGAGIAIRLLIGR